VAGPSLGTNPRGLSVPVPADVWVMAAPAGAAMDTLFAAERRHRPSVGGPPAAPGPALTDPAAARRWLDTERASLTAVVAYASGHGWAGHATRLAATLFRYLDTGGYYAQAVTVHDHARRGARQAGDLAAEATALTNLGAVDLRQSRYQQEALALFRESGSQAG
jgi:hypothetical protein